jgi:hypothetical protein
MAGIGLTRPLVESAPRGMQSDLSPLAAADALHLFHLYANPTPFSTSISMHHDLRYR